MTWGMHMCVRAQVSAGTCICVHMYVCVPLGVSLEALEVGDGRAMSHGSSPTL